jgi:hypothetical protein
MVPDKVDYDYYSLKSGEGREIMRDGAYYEG